MRLFLLLKALELYFCWKVNNIYRKNYTYIKERKKRIYLMSKLQNQTVRAYVEELLDEKKLFTRNNPSIIYSNIQRKQISITLIS